MGYSPALLLPIASDRLLTISSYPAVLLSLASDAHLLHRLLPLSMRSSSLASDAHLLRRLLPLSMPFSPVASDPFLHIASPWTPPPWPQIDSPSRRPPSPQIGRPSPIVPRLPFLSLAFTSVVSDQSFLAVRPSPQRSTSPPLPRLLLRSQISPPSNRPSRPPPLPLLILLSLASDSVRSIVPCPVRCRVLFHTYYQICHLLSVCCGLWLTSAAPCSSCVQLYKFGLSL